jgi:hypothetical protein
MRDASTIPLKPLERLGNSLLLLFRFRLVVEGRITQDGFNWIHNYFFSAGSTTTPSRIASVGFNTTTSPADNPELISISAP